MSASEISKMPRPHRMSAKQRAPLALALTLMIALLTSGCVGSGGSATVAQVGAELNEVLPTVSVNDTEQTKSENADFREVFFSIYPLYRPKT